MKRRLKWIGICAGGLVLVILGFVVEEHVRVSGASFEVAARRPGGEETLVFKAVPNRATGETVGDTSFFAAQAEWLKTAKTFDAVLKELKVKGNVHQNVAFNFPKGNDTDEK